MVEVNDLMIDDVFVKVKSDWLLCIYILAIPTYNGSDDIFGPADTE